MSELNSSDTVKTAAKFIGIGMTKAYELFNTPGFPSFRVGKKLLVNHNDLIDWINKQIDLNRQENERIKH